MVPTPGPSQHTPCPSGLQSGSARPPIPLNTPSTHKSTSIFKVKLPPRGLFLGVVAQAGGEGREGQLGRGLQASSLPIRWRREDGAREGSSWWQPRAGRGGRLTGHFLWMIPSPTLVCLWGPQGGSGSLVHGADRMHRRTGKARTPQALHRRANFFRGPLPLVCLHHLPSPAPCQTSSRNVQSVWVTAVPGSRISEHTRALRSL